MARSHPRVLVTVPPIRHPSQIGRLPWRRLLPGVLTLAAVVVAAVLVLTLAEIGGVRGRTIRIYTALGDAREIIPNTEVWLHGELIGVVRSVEFRSTATDPDARILVALDVLDRARPHVRRDALVQIRPGESFLGAPVLYVSGGTPSAPAVQPGDTLRSSVRLDPDETSREIRRGLSDARAVLENVRRAAAGMRSARGSIAELVGRESEADRAALRRVRASLARLTSGEGAVPALLAADSPLRQRLDSLRLRVDSLTAQSAGSSARLLAEDEALPVATAALAAEVADVRARIRARLTRPAGDTLAAGWPDSASAVPDSVATALARELSRLDVALDALLRDLRRRPWRYVDF